MTTSTALAKATVRLAFLLVWEGPAAARSEPLGDLPATFTGGTRQIELYPDRTYVSHGGGAPDDIGRWTLEDGDRTLVLHGLRPEPVALPVAQLRRSDRLQPIEPRVTVRGTYQPATGGFTECVTGKQWPVLHDREGAALAATSGDRQQLMVSLAGRVSMRALHDGARPRPALVIETIMRVAPGESCGGLSAERR